MFVQEKIEALFNAATKKKQNRAKFGFENK